jgi:cyclopropane fatty-acyl-phospholipid synthase-like methyltransferase
MDKSLLVRIFGYRAALVHGDTLMLDRWQWLKARLPVTANGEYLIDIGCGGGAFTIAAVRRGYVGLGLTWDAAATERATQRARICKANAKFLVQDARKLGERNEFNTSFDIVISCENIEHVIDDRKLMRDMYSCLKPGGSLLLTTPYRRYKPITGEDNGPFVEIEDGRHVRRGYTSAMLRELCDDAGFVVEEISSCSGFTSQKITWLMRRLSDLGHLGWAITFPLRILPPLVDRIIAKVTGWPDYSICIVAYKPRFSSK